MNFLIILNCSVFSSNNFVGWICTWNKNKALKTIKFSFSAILPNLLYRKFWNHFQADIFSRVPCIWVFLQFSICSRKIKIVVSLELSWVVGYQTFKNTKNCSQIFFFLFLIVCQEKSQPVNYYLSGISSSTNVKIRKLKFKFWAFYADFLKFLPSEPIVLWRGSY